MPITRKHPFNVSMEPIAEKIMASGRKRGLSGDRLKRYAYGALNRMGAKRGNVTTMKGAAMMAEHRAETRGKIRKYESRVRMRRRRPPRIGRPSRTGMPRGPRRPRTRR